MNEHLHKEFLKIVSEMNKLNIIPLLLGSFGLEKVTNKSWQASDIDIYLIDEEVLNNQYEDIQKILIDRNYVKSLDSYRTYVKDNVEVEYKSFFEFQKFVKIDKEKLNLIRKEGVQYYLPTLEQFIEIYSSSVRDPKRKGKKQKDAKKLKYLKEM
ncbi:MULTISPECIES: hypothetical protein [Streptococcus]|uniref:Phosphoribosylanthranilate isomerase n=1 Tax=Streptococcus parauberis TaxID=1348 RepID=A0A854W642_9STRE|nr:MULTISPECIES: hypothetical protein [Streptococcus]PCH10805.1 hypothetical protein A9Y57_02095 [Streptococcus parauberis]